MSGFDHNDLRALAEAATPGPWRTWIEGEGDAWGGDPCVVAATPGRTVCELATIADTRFIAAANPTAILALLDRILVLEAQI